MTAGTTDLGFFWWNVQDCAHYDPTRARAERWPESPAEYDAKRQRIEEVLKRICSNRPHQLIALGEVTDRAAQEIRNNLFPQYRIHQLSSLYAKPDFHIAILYDPAYGFVDEDFHTVANVPDTTRPIPTVDHLAGNHRIRFYVTHWTARMKAISEKWRQLTAYTISIEVYKFLNPDESSGEQRHAVVIGDFNEEPFGLLGDWLHSGRERRRARSAGHYTDNAIRRVRMYNCAWRLLGECTPHRPAPTEREIAGTYYWQEEKSWHTLDQVIVSGGLLNSVHPYLDEQSLRIAGGRTDIPDNLLDEAGLPCKFSWNRGKPMGVSDHLPICGTIKVA